MPIIFEFLHMGFESILRGFESVGQISPSVMPTRFKIRILFFRDLNLCLPKNLTRIGIRIRSMRDLNLVFFKTFSKHTGNGIQIHSLRDSNPLFWIPVLQLFEIRIRIYPLGDLTPTFKFCIFLFCLLGFISFALALNTFLKTLNSLISKHIKSVLISSKSIRDQP